MSKGGVKLNFHLPKGIKENHSHVNRRDKKKQPPQSSALLSSNVLTLCVILW